MDLTPFIHRLTNPKANKTGIIGEVVAITGWSKNTVYRQLAKAGYTSVRKTRSDKGTTKVDDSTLRTVSTLMQQGIRKNGKATMTVAHATSILATNGVVIEASTSTIARQLRNRGLDRQSLTRPTAHTGMASLHPNHTHQVDASVPLFWFTPTGIYKGISDAESYKNKPFKAKVLRYVLTDHTSGCIYARYYEADGENAITLYSFLLSAWGVKENKAFAFHGVPKHLVWDKGSANRAKSITHALTILGVNTIAHKAGNPRAKGQVEQAQNIIETLFESRFKVEPIHGLDALNKAAEAFCQHYNSNTIPHYDSRLHRLGTEPLVRASLWGKITSDQLVMLPPRTLCQRLLTLDYAPRKVKGNLTITYAHPHCERTGVYDVRDVDGIYVDASLKVRPILLGGETGAIEVSLENYLGHVVQAAITPLEFTDAGFRLDAPIIGENYKAQKQPSVLEAIEDALIAHSHLTQPTNTLAMPRRGRALELPARYQPQPATPLTTPQVAQVWINQGKWDKSYYPVLEALYPNGVLEEELDKAYVRVLDTGKRSAKHA